MPTLHVRNVPEHLYESLRRYAEEQGTSIGGAAVALLSRALGTHLAGVREMLDEYERYRPTAKPGTPSGAELIRGDRDRR